MSEKEILEALFTLRSIFPPDSTYNTLVAEGACGDEEFTMRGDDLASACWSLDQLMKHFCLEGTYIEMYRKVYNV